jgi:hypothetical protein
MPGSRVVGLAICSRVSSNASTVAMPFTANPSVLVPGKGGLEPMSMTGVWARLRIALAANASVPTPKCAPLASN